MKTKTIKLTNMKDINDFAKHALNVDGDVLIRKGVYCVSGSSLLGMYSIDTSTGVQVEYPEDASDFDSYIEQFAC